ncbi:MAG: ABC transporter permease [Chloroflexi bacterium]|nr:ABC transporter permease [Chloroflexota bacterium]
MTAYIIRRILMVIPVLIGASILVFAALRLVPGDPAVAIAGELATPQLVAQVRQDLGLDRSIAEQYVIYMSKAIRGDLGRSVKTGGPILEEITNRLPNTILLACSSLLVAATIGILLGIMAAIRPYSWIDGGSMVMALLGASMPVFWLGLMIMALFAVVLPRWWGLSGPILPPTGSGTWQHLVMPTITLAANSMAILARMTRATMLEVLRQDYVRTSRAKGLTERLVIFRHALRNALIPVITILGLQFGILLSGAVLTETVFAWPGIGRLLVDAISYRDYPVVQAVILVIAVGFTFVNLVVDVFYAFLDPRIRYA